MKKCYSCGAMMRDEAKFCARCGKALAITKELIDRTKVNDQDAIAELYGRTYNRIIFQIKTKMSDSDIAEDLAQDVYVRAFSRLEQLEEPAAFPSWLSTIARNMVSDWYRKYGRDREKQEYQQPDYTDDGSAEDEIETVAEYRTDMIPDEYMDRLETDRLMSEILDTLPEGQRIVLTMRYSDQCSLKEIAEELDLNINTVKTRLAQGRKNVEVKVRELAKKGTKLYGLAPIPFLLMLLKSLEDGAMEAEAAKMPAELMAAVREARVVSSIGYHSSDTAAEYMDKPAQGGASSGSSASGAAVQGTVKAAGSAAARGIGMKAVIGIVIAAVAVGGAALAVTKPWQDHGTDAADAEEAAEEETETDAAEEEAVVEEEEAAAITTQEELYSAYAHIVEEYEEEYGEGGYAGYEDDIGYSVEYRYMTGTFLLELVDFDNDGWEELLVGVEDQSQHDSEFSAETFMADTWADIWALVDGDVQKVYSPEEAYIVGENPSNLSYGNDVGASIQYNTYSDGAKCMQQSELAGGENASQYFYINNIFQETSLKEDEFPVSYTWYNTFCFVDQAEETLSVTEKTKVTLGLLEDPMAGLEEWRVQYAEYLDNAEIEINSYTGEGEFFLIYLNDDDIPELFYFASFFAEGSGVIYIHDGEVMVQEMNNAWAGLEYAERGGYISAMLYQMESGVEEAYFWDGSSAMEQLFGGTFYYEGPLTDDPQYYVYESGPTGYTSYSIYDGEEYVSCTEDEYLEKHSKAYSWRTDERYIITSIDDSKLIGEGKDAAIEYLTGSN
ncbi:MAG: sigma-70 family RNA polymerase sigma factor [Lachnospiraceae bacterium]|nr:sigma-70 family RNA polymerase sigma factor [Lachnospiraceae bacterium]